MEYDVPILELYVKEIDKLPSEYVTKFRYCSIGFYHVFIILF